MKDIAFIDLEASGLGARSWPIEVGWCCPGGKPRSFLIKPDADWEMDAWDLKAEQLHGVKRAALDQHGDPPEVVCAALNAALQGHIVYSDAPDWDGFWLYRLFQAGGVKQAFALSDFGEVFSMHPPEALDDLVAKAAKIAPHRHRTNDDVLHMKALYELAAKDD